MKNNLLTIHNKSTRNHIQIQNSNSNKTHVLCFVYPDWWSQQNFKSYVTQLTWHMFIFCFTFPDKWFERTNIHIYHRSTNFHWLGSLCCSFITYLIRECMFVRNLNSQVNRKLLNITIAYLCVTNETCVWNKIKFMR